MCGRKPYRFLVCAYHIIAYTDVTHRHRQWGMVDMVETAELLLDTALHSYQYTFTLTVCCK